MSESLDRYSREIHDTANTGHQVEFTLEQLIASHKHLRSLNLELSATRQEAVAKAYEHAKVLAMDATWVKWDDLRAMTINELVERLSA